MSRGESYTEEWRWDLNALSGHSYLHALPSTPFLLYLPGNPSMRNMESDNGGTLEGKMQIIINGVL